MGRGGVAARIGAKVGVKIAAKGFSRALSSKIGKKFVSNRLIEDWFDEAADQGADEAGEQIIAVGKQAAIAAMASYPLNDGQESIFYGQIAPWFERLPNDPDECQSKLTTVYAEFGDYLEFMSIIIDTGVGVMENAIIAAKTAEWVSNVAAFF